MKTVKFAESLSIFVDVARAQSFSEVARRRGMVASSVARQIGALESELKVPLFVRSTRALMPTEAGEVLYERAVKILHDMTEARSEVISLEQTVQGLLRVSCLPAFARRYVVPMLQQLGERHPQLQVELELTERVVDPVVERMDVVVRVGQQPDSSLIGQRIGSHRYLICAAPSYLERHGVPRTLADLSHHRLIDRRHSTSVRGWRELGNGQWAQDARFVLECDDCDARRFAALEGLGIALMPNWSAGADIGAGRLVQLALQDASPPPESGIYLLRAMPRANARIRAFTEQLRRQIGSPSVWDMAIQAAS
ncbi:LysR family transcriptional regulator [Achromobacter insolitus]|uniref:LysR family transcriptional regulator n=1 Tax=Achromobacter insolitus TaxID=217204 RepID=UPI003B9B46B0